MNVLELTPNPSMPRNSALPSVETGTSDDVNSGTESFQSHLSREQRQQESAKTAPATKPDDTQKADIVSTAESDLEQAPETVVDPKPLDESQTVPLTDTQILEESRVFALSSSVSTNNRLSLNSSESGESLSEHEVDLFGLKVQDDTVEFSAGITSTTTKSAGAPLHTNLNTQESFLQSGRAAIFTQPPGEKVQAEVNNTNVQGLIRPNVDSALDATKAMQTQMQSTAKNALSLDEVSEFKFGEVLDKETVDVKSINQVRGELHSVASLIQKSELATQQPSNARFTVNVQFGRAEWMADVAAQVAKVAAQNLNFAEIQLDPPELGALQVRVHMNNEQAAVSFSAQSAQVREALEQNGNRLREMFDAEGLSLVDVDVRDQGQQNSGDELESEAADLRDSTEDSSGISLSDASVIETEIQVGVDDYV